MFVFTRQDHPRELPLELIEREIEQLAAQINAGNARWLELVAEFDRREGWGGTRLPLDRRMGGLALRAHPPLGARARARRAGAAGACR